MFQLLPKLEEEIVIKQEKSEIEDATVIEDDGISRVDIKESNQNNK